MFKKIALGLGLVGIGAYLYEALKDYKVNNPFELAKRNDWLSASSLQLSGNNLIGRVSNPTLAELLNKKDRYKSNRLKRDQEAGTTAHRIIQQSLAAQGLGTPEYYLEDTQNKVFGSVDFMLNSGIPLEIKTLEPGSIFKLSRPKPSHVSQINFDMIAAKSNVGYLMYVDRNDTRNRKVFTMAPDLSLYASDVSRGRMYQEAYGSLQTASPFLSGFRPLNSLIQVNNDVPVIMNRSKYAGQKQRLANLPAYQMSLSSSNHPNEKGRSNAFS